MVDITPLIPAGRMVIEGYSPTSVTINGTSHALPLMVSADNIQPLPTLDTITVDTICTALSEAQCEILLAGTGNSIHFFDSTFERGLRTLGITLDVMNTGAACRTYNVLLSEERPVAALLFPME